MRRVLLCLAWFAATTTLRAADVPAIVDYVAAHREPSVVASIPWDRYAGDLRALPVGVFDSGIGGLTVLEAILKLDAYDNATGRPGADGAPDFAGERFVYLGDQPRAIDEHSRRRRGDGTQCGSHAVSRRLLARVRGSRRSAGRAVVFRPSRTAAGVASLTAFAEPVL